MLVHWKTKSLRFCLLVHMPFSYDFIKRVCISTFARKYIFVYTMDVPNFRFFLNQSTFFELVSCFHLVGGLHYRPCPFRVGGLALYISREFDETIHNLDFLLGLLETVYFIPRNPVDLVYRICMVLQN